MTMPDPILVWTAERQRVQFEAENLAACGREKEAGRAWRRHAALASIIEQTPAISLAGLAAQLELALRYDDADFEVLLQGVCNIESAAP